MARVWSALVLALGLLVLGPVLSGSASETTTATSTGTDDWSQTTSAPSPTGSLPSSSGSPTEPPETPGDQEQSTTGPSTSSPTPSEPTSTDDTTVTLAPDQWVQVEIALGCLVFFAALSTIAAFGWNRRSS